MTDAEKAKGEPTSDGPYFESGESKAEPAAPTENKEFARRLLENRTKARSSNHHHLTMTLPLFDKD
jgi:hypothetical protein